MNAKGPWMFQPCLKHRFHAVNGVRARQAKSLC
jgi:hypothetical protein